MNEPKTLNITDFEMQLTAAEHGPMVNGQFTMTYEIILRRRVTLVVDCTSCLPLKAPTEEASCMAEAPTT